MKQLKHPATVIAALALFVALGSGAWASGLISGANIRNHSIAAKKLTRHAVKSLHGRRGARGPAGPAGPQGAAGTQGPAGSALAFAHINPDGTLDAALSSGVTAANFTHNGAGEYCFSGLSFTPKNVVASIDAASGAASTGAVAHVALGTASTCPSGSQVAVTTTNDSVAGNEGTYILFN
jgi:hypothetical protein